MSAISSFTRLVKSRQLFSLPFTSSARKFKSNQAHPISSARKSLPNISEISEDFSEDNVPTSLTAELASRFEDSEFTVQTIKPKLEKDFVLHSGKTLPKDSIQIKYSTIGKPEAGKPIILLCPSMSNNVYAIDGKEEVVNEKGEKVIKEYSGWWRGVVGHGSQFGIDLNKFFVVCGAPLGSPFGSTSPVTINPRTGERFGPEFPQITPEDQAKLHSLLLDELNIPKVHAVVGGSMGGMQSIQFAANFPEKYDRFVSIASTAQTSPGIVALRSVQRAAVKNDPDFHDGLYYKHMTKKHGDEGFHECEGPIRGMRVARMFGTICYRSHTEFVGRFNWYPEKMDKEENSFEVERYLNHQADIFISRSRYDANCYLLNSKSMDLMDIGSKDKSLSGQERFAEGVKRIPSDKEALLLSYSTDKLTPPEDLERLSSVLGNNGVDVHYEVLESTFGHDAFLIEREAPEVNMRLKAFLEGKSKHGVHSVHKLVKELLHV